METLLAKLESVGQLSMVESSELVAGVRKLLTENSRLKAAKMIRQRDLEQLKALRDQLKVVRKQLVEAQKK